MKAIYVLLPWRRLVNLVSPSLEDTSTLSSSLKRETTPPRRPLSSKLMVRRQNCVNKGNFWGCQRWPKCNGSRRLWAERREDEREEDKTREERREKIHFQCGGTLPFFVDGVLFLVNPVCTRDLSLPHKCQVRFIVDFFQCILKVNNI